MNIHVQRDPHRKQRGYYVVGWTADSDRAIAPAPFNPETDCETCQGRAYVPNDEVNARRHHYMNHMPCRACGGTGRKNHEG